MGEQLDNFKFKIEITTLHGSPGGGSGGGGGRRTVELASVEYVEGPNYTNQIMIAFAVIFIAYLLVTGGKKKRHRR